MPDRRDPPPTDEGWYTLHDFRTIDWDAWRSAPERERQRALEDGVEFFESALAVEDSDDGASALYSILGHKADFLVLHLRPSTADTGALERRFEQTEFARFTERTTSFVSVTEASGYSERARDYFTGDLDESSGLYNYIQSRLKPSIPDATHVCFYPMDKRRQPEQNWYDLSFEERAEHMDAHGDIGRDYGGKVQQMITGAIAMDDWEWGVTLWGDDLTDMKDLLYEMRFDPSTSQYADFGSFYVGRRFPPADLPALLSGEPVPSDETDGATETGPVHPADADHAGGHAHGETDHAEEHGHDDADHGEAAHGHGDTDHAEGHGHDGADSRDSAHPGSSAEGDHPHDSEETETEDIASLLATLGLDGGEDYDAGDYGLVLYSTADAGDLADEVDDLRGNFEHYDSHVTTVVRAHGGRAAIVSIWDNEGAADTAHGFLTDLSGVTETVRGPLDGSGETETEAADDEDGAESIREELADLDIYAGQPHGEDIYALVLYSEADREELLAEVEDLSDGFDRYDTHEGTKVYADPDSERNAVVSLWETEDAADTASGYLSDLPGVVGWAGEGEGFGTMGMFYTVEPEHREDFVEKFGTVGELLGDMDGHRETSLLSNVDDENDMFIASQWDSKEDAMGFFRSDAFSDTVDWGRDILADKPRHVFLA
ncbi:heme-binding protein [Salinibaculum rarum]|uniref:heme-binding protein n=1 Tax=Salinibaculum rarum TaxID=3058903 RepID=UPI00265FC439|nr:heme-binding protein [Salinibaculum sp. KK48]